MLPNKQDLYNESSAPPDQIEELMRHIRSFKRRPKGYRALHLHFSLLDRLHQQPQNRREIAKAFINLVQKYDGQLFWTSRFDLYVVCKNATTQDIDSAVLDARRAVENSPVMQEYTNAGRDAELCDWYDMAEAYDDFAAHVEKVYAKADEPEETPEAKSPSLKSMVQDLKKLTEDAEDEPAPKPKKKAPTTVPRYDLVFKKETTPAMGPMELDKLERNLANIDMSRLISEQDTCVVVGNAPPQIVFTERFISTKEISDKVLPGYDLMADKWLFLRLTRSFDQKMMSDLLDGDLPVDKTISINMNVETILSPDFDKFAKKYNAKTTQPLILEVQLADIMSDLKGYYTAVQKIKKVGFKISLDAIDVQAIAALNREILDVDFLKVRWHKDYKTSLSSDLKQEIISAIRGHGKMRMILCHCDSEDAIQFGQEVGIHMYQGHLIDKLRGLS